MTTNKQKQDVFQFYIHFLNMNGVLKIKLTTKFLLLIYLLITI